MDVVTYTHARQNLAKLMDETQANHEPIVINRQQKGSVVMMSLEDYNGLMETLHLLRSPRNAERLLRSIRQAERGEVVIREPIDPDRGA
ncbi:type II toxin-antitoxin system Phd/YefM family antitoxin [Elioraea sp.]|uniref:type II toxin-antitoxin system Phd/YefM family antitoxin n=1 Tax=Elioraea sp. TaxID=2185103 RepID=UPI003F724614